MLYYIFAEKDKYNKDVESYISNNVFDEDKYNNIKDKIESI